MACPIWKCNYRIGLIFLRRISWSSCPSLLWCLQVWNIQNGHNLHQLESVMEAEITGIVPLPDKKLILSVGWSRMITQYEDSDPDVRII